MTGRLQDLLRHFPVERPGEYWLFLYWIITKQQIYPTLQWGIRKLRNRFFTARNQSVAYPKEVSAIASHCNLLNNFVSHVGSQAEVGMMETPNSICLAGVELDVFDGRVDWCRTFIDREDEESLHRWNWILHFLGRKKSKIDDLYWAVQQMNSWIDQFQNELQLKKIDGNRMARWDSYTISERLSNACILFFVSGIEPSSKVVKALIEQSIYLVNNLEYRKEYTSNHIINNGRALYLVGATFDVSILRSLGQTLLKRELQELISPAGFVREGSSHYQFLITRWLLEVRHFSEGYAEPDFREMLEKCCEKLETQCQFFLPRNNHALSSSIPLFGDISPDFPPEWLSHILTSRLSYGGSSNIGAERLPEFSWNWIWKDNYQGAD